MSFKFGPMELSMNFVFHEFKYCYAILHPEEVLAGHVMLVPKTRAMTFSSLQYVEVMD